MLALNILLPTLTLMASPNDIAKLPRIKPGRRGALAQLLELQRMVFEAATHRDTTPLALAALVRAYCLLEERKRILRGIPLPGQLRPDLDPVQLQRALRRHRARALDLLPSTLAGCTGPIEVPPEPAKYPSPEPSPAK